MDSSLFVALSNKRDNLHGRAVLMMKEILNYNYGKIFFSDYIFDESFTLFLARTKNFKGAIDFGNTLLKSKDLNRLEVDAVVFSEAWGLINAARAPISFTDATSVVLMQKFRIQHIASFDSDFDKIPQIKRIS